jgi:DNA-binding CsgD family transcriptional regulator
MERAKQVDPDPDAAGDPPLAGVELHRLVAELVRRAGGPEAARRSAGHALLDVEVDGVRCVLLPPTALADAAEPPRAGPPLSPREYQIARMVGLGHTNKTIAEGLGISLWTVSTHLRRIFAKLGVSTRAAMVAVLAADLAASRQRARDGRLAANPGGPGAQASPRPERGATGCTAHGRGSPTASTSVSTSATGSRNRLMSTASATGDQG